MRVYRGACPCSVNGTCDDGHTCNCDANLNKWYSDEGHYTTVESLGITEMYFLQQNELDDESRGRITLGSLECVETSMYLSYDKMITICVYILKFSD